MAHLNKVIALIAVALSSCLAFPKAEVCPEGCKCYSTWLNCSYAGLDRPPSGNWPNVDILWVVGNNIQDFEENSLSGFPSLRSLWLNENPTSVLKLDSFAFAKAANLKKISYQDSEIEVIVPLSSEYALNSLEELDLTNNSLMWVDRDILSFMPQLTTLKLNRNPLVIIQGTPLFSHENLNYLGLSYINANALSQDTFQLLPNLGELALINSRVRSMAGAFLHLDRLVWLYLQDNLITSVDVQQISPSGRFRWFDVSRNPLQRFDPEAINGTLHAGYVMINDTPLACSCAYEDLYWWAKEDKTWLTATCGSVDICEFSDK